VVLESVVKESGCRQVKGQRMAESFEYDKGPIIPIVVSLMISV
jgi:hypothetical protein